MSSTDRFQQSRRNESEQPTIPDRRQFLSAAIGLSSTVAFAGCSGVPFLGGDDSRPTIAYGETVEGEITDNSPTDPNRKGTAVPYTFEGTKGDSPVVTMTADSFQPFVLVTNPYDHLVSKEDEHMEGKSKLLTELQQDGTHTIWAGSASKTATGSFTLSLSGQNSG